MKQIVCMLAVVLTALTAMAQNIDEKAGATTIARVPASMEALHLASGLARYGYSTQSATALAEAARIFIDNPTIPSDAVVEHGESDGTEGVKTGKVSYEVDQILADAKQFADGDETVLALIADVENIANATHRGAVGPGPCRHYDRVKAHATDVYRIKFREGESAVVVVSGDGDTDLDLYVYDMENRLIVKDDDYTDDCVVRWVPTYTGNHIIKITNRGDVYNAYRFYHN